MDLSAAWRLARVIKRLEPGRDPRARSARRRDGVAGAVARPRRRRRRPIAGAGRVAPRRLPPEGQLASRGGSTARSTASSPPRRRSARCWSPTACPTTKTVTVHEGIDVEHVVAAPPVNVHEAFWLPHQAPVVGNVAALVPHKGQRHLIEAAHLVVQRGAGRPVRDPRRRRAARAARAAGARASSREARAAARLPHRRARLHQGLRSVRR